MNSIPTKCALVAITGSSLDSYTSSKLWYATDLVLWLFWSMFHNNESMIQITLTIVIIQHRVATFWELLGARNQNMEKKNILIRILQFFLRLCLSNCVLVLTLRKTDRQKKRLCFPWYVRFYMIAGCFAFMREILHAWRESVRNSVQAWDSWSMLESWQPWTSMRFVGSLLTFG